MTQDTIRVGSGVGDDEDETGNLERGDLFAPPTPEDALDGTSALEALREALATPAVSEPVTLRVPARPGVSIRCHTRMEQEDRTAWRKRATPRQTGGNRRRGREPEPDEMEFALLVLANTCEAILFNGSEASTSDGGPLTFRSTELWRMVEAPEPRQAIRRFFSNDAHILIASGEVLLASGFDDDLEEEEGPTRG